MPYGDKEREKELARKKIRADKFIWQENDVELVDTWLCRKCKHWYGWNTCAAFPNGMPDDIWTGKVKHTRPYPGDNGIRFERKKEG